MKVFCLLLGTPNTKCLLLKTTLVFSIRGKGFFNDHQNSAHQKKSPDWYLHFIPRKSTFSQDFTPPFRSDLGHGLLFPAPGRAAAAAAAQALEEAATLEGPLARADGWDSCGENSNQPHYQSINCH